MKKRKFSGKLSLKKSRISKLDASLVKGGTGNATLHSCPGQGNDPGGTCYTAGCGGGGTNGCNPSNPCSGTSVFITC